MMLVQVALTTSLVGIVLMYGLPGYWPGRVRAEVATDGFRLEERKGTIGLSGSAAALSDLPSEWLARIEHDDAIRLACIPLRLLETPVQALERSSLRRRELIYHLRGFQLSADLLEQFENAVVVQEFLELIENPLTNPGHQSPTLVDVLGQTWRVPTKGEYSGRPAFLHVGPRACLAAIEQCFARQKSNLQALASLETELVVIENQKSKLSKGVAELGVSVDLSSALREMNLRIESASRVERASELLKELQSLQAWGDTPLASIAGQLESELRRIKSELAGMRSRLSEELGGSQRSTFESSWQELVRLEHARLALEMESRVRVECQLAGFLEVAQVGFEASQPQELSFGISGGSEGSSVDVQQIGDAMSYRLRLSRELGDFLDSENPEPKSWRLVRRTLNLDGMHRLVQVNQLTLIGKLRLYASKWLDFFTLGGLDSKGRQGMFAALWGTVVLTLLMTVIVVPLGVVAAIYLHEYTARGPLVSLLRISINNLAGVPSIVYGVFGVAFFCYTIGAFIDGGPENAGIVPLPLVTWYLLVGTMAFLASIAFLSSFYLVGRTGRLSRWAPRLSLSLWLFSLLGLLFLAATCPLFAGFFSEQLPSPTFGKGGILWAAMTLSLLTLPTVIVSTEESLAAVPNSLRIASAACGATRWQTIRRVVLPNSRFGVLTGAALAISRAIGQVAPLMLLGALPFAPDLPLDSRFPFLHGSRGFKHLGYEIYNLGLRSEGAEQMRPDVFAAILLLFAVLVGLNLAASTLRRRGLLIAQVAGAK